MELLTTLQNMMKNASSFEKSKNYYYENHNCEKNGNNIKINLNYKLSTDDNDKIMKFGICKHCNTLFYYYDFESNYF